MPNVQGAARSDVVTRFTRVPSSGVDTDTNRTIRLFNPRRDAWARHFVRDGLWIRGLTATGRATIWLLEFNSDERLKLREGLYKLGFLT